jgi:sialate O-acetylesterase
MGAKRWIAAIVSGIVIAVASGQSLATVKPHALFGPNMVLQQGRKVPVWGTAEDGEKVTVRFQDQAASAVAKDGRWRVELNNLKPGGPFAMTIEGTNRIELPNVLVGEVWICSGQSNMQWPLSMTENAKENIAQAANPNLRLFTVERRGRPRPEADVPLIPLSAGQDAFRANPQGIWLECTPRSAEDFSAVAYYFGAELQKTRGVPVGLIHTSFGGTPAQAWTRREALAAVPELKIYLDQFDAAQQSYVAARNQYAAAAEAYRAAAQQAKEAGKTPPQLPPAPVDPGTSQGSASTLYNAMIAPLIPFAIQGAIWYQGESNAFSLEEALRYRTLFPAMIENWREDWKLGDFPFLFVQLAPWNGASQATWPELWESQLLTTRKLPKVAMAVITDLGDEKDIHPKKKQPVGARLALAARALAYGEDVVYSGPLYESMAVDGNTAILSFQHAGGGLMARDGELVGFTIAGADKKFVKAEAQIDGDKLKVSSPDVERPVAVRYGWENFPKPTLNLFNKEGLPASPFRTDLPGQM